MVAADPIEVTYKDIGSWNMTVAGARECVHNLDIVGPLLPDRPNIKRYSPGQEEVEATNAMALDAVNGGRMIDLGHLPNNVMMDCGRRGGPMYTHGGLIQPFRQPWLLYHTWEGGGALYLINLIERDRPAGGRFEIVELEPFLVNGHRVLTIADRGMLMPDPADIETRYTGTVIPSVWRFVPGNEQINRGMQPELAAAANLFDPVMTALLILGTNGVARETVAAPEKLNKARVKSGKPLIPNYQRVDTKFYVTALTMRHDRTKHDPQGGTHASPIPHLRRGTIRTYPSGVRSIIMDTLVRVSPEVRVAFKARQGSFSSSRSHYEVKP